MSVLFNFAKPLLFRLEAEQAHNLTIAALKSGLVAVPKADADPEALGFTLWNRKFSNPLGLAAGFDKNADVIGPMLRMGFGFVEAGTVTPRPQNGNPKPRVFRDVENEAVINAMGFPGAGMNKFRANIESFLERKPRPDGLVGINIGMNKDQTDPARDYVALVQKLGPYADYLTVNISSPNTPGLRDLQEKSAFLDLIGKIKKARSAACGAGAPPLLVKFSPDLDEAQQRSLALACVEAGIDGMILTNTTLDRPAHLPGEFRDRKGGLSGRPLTGKSTDVISNFYRLTRGQIPIIGLGGISSGRDAYDKIRAGASMVQIYTAMVFQGPELIGRIKRELVKYLQEDGFSYINEAVGADHKF